MDFLKPSIRDPYFIFDQWYHHRKLPTIFKVIHFFKGIGLIFFRWIDPGLQRVEQNTMCLSTSDGKNISSRIVLLKSFDNSGFVFYTNYESQKGQDIKACPSGSLLFFYQLPLRQIRISGTLEKVSRSESEGYWATRPFSSKVSGTVSKQSEIVESYEKLELTWKKYLIEKKGAEIPCPENWGGYKLVPHRFEFWEGKVNRLHKRLVFKKNEDQKSWTSYFISP